MLTQLTVDELRFLSRFAASPDYRALDIIFSRELASLDEKCRTTDAPAVYRFQGAGSMLVDIGKAIVGAADELQRRVQIGGRPALRPVNGAAEQAHRSTIRS